MKDRFSVLSSQYLCRLVTEIVRYINIEPMSTLILTRHRRYNKWPMPTKKHTNNAE